MNENKGGTLRGMRRARAIALTCCLLLGLALPAWNSGQNHSGHKVAPAGARDAATDLQIHSSVLRIEFDRKLYSRVIPLFDEIAKPIVPFSASETVAGVNHTWSDFVLASAHREPVADAFGTGERLSLTGKSGDLRKNIAVTIYADFPSIAVFEFE